MPRNLHSSSGKPGTSENAAIRSPLVSNAVKKYRPANNDQLEKEFNRKHMVDEKRRRNKTMVMSPAHVQSPKAHPSTTIKSPIGSKGALFVQQGISSTSIHASRLASLPVSPSSMRISSGTNNDSGSLTITKNVSVEQVIILLAKNGIQVDEKEAKIILELLYLVSKIMISQKRKKC